MDKASIEAYLHQHIPLSAAMHAQVELLAAEQVILSAPLAPNINHRDTVFGGSASTLAILAAWTLVHTRLQRAGIPARVVIQRHSMSYDKPIIGTFYACCVLSDLSAWQRFETILQRKGRARIGMQVRLESRAEPVGQFSGDFVAINV